MSMRLRSSWIEYHLCRHLDVVRCEGKIKRWERSAVYGVLGRVLNLTKTHLIVRALLFNSVLSVWCVYPLLHSATCHAQSRAASSSEREEYAVYSAFINQAYVNPNIDSGFTLQGKVIEGFSTTDIKEVVLGRSCAFWGTAYVPLANVEEELPPIAYQAFKDLLAKNTTTCTLREIRGLNIKATFLTEQENQEAAKEGDSRVTMRKFNARHPNALGYLSLSRVGFDSTMHTAILSVSQADFNIRSYTTRTFGFLVVLAKENGRWVVKRTFPELRQLRSLMVDLSLCHQASTNLAWGLGSQGVTVKGREGNECIIEHVNEVEGGYAKSECHIPTSLGKVEIINGGQEFIFTVDISKYCRVTKTGNVFLDRHDR